MEITYKSIWIGIILLNLSAWICLALEPFVKIQWMKFRGCVYEGKIEKIIYNFDSYFDWQIKYKVKIYIDDGEELLINCLENNTNINDEMDTCIGKKVDIYYNPTIFSEEEYFLKSFEECEEEELYDSGFATMSLHSENIITSLMGITFWGLILISLLSL